MAGGVTDAATLQEAEEREDESSRENRIIGSLCLSLSLSLSLTVSYVFLSLSFFLLVFSLSVSVSLHILSFALLLGQTGSFCPLGQDNYQPLTVLGPSS